MSASGKGAAGPPRQLLHGHAAAGTLLAAGRARDALVFAAGAAAAVALVVLLAPATAPSSLWPGVGGGDPFPATPESTTRTFYDDPKLSYAVPVGGGVEGARRVTNWDAKRAAWLRSRGLSPTSPSVASRVVMVSGSKPEPCRDSGGDHLLLRFLKNKLDYCRLHPNVELLYNRNLLHPSMPSYWAKIPAVRAAMLAHPDAEWVWWVDADAVFTDMDFALPLDRYADGGHNLVVYGWEKEVYERRSWLGLNAGVFLIRNCQWSLDLMDAWAAMGPASPEYMRWGKTMKKEMAGKPTEEADDQSALVYLLSADPERWGQKTLVACDYYFQGYWVGIVDQLDGVAARYDAVEARDQAGGLRRRHAEREHLRYAAARNAAVRAPGGVPGPDGGGEHGWRRPFVTHFTGCSPCDARWRNPAFSAESCDQGMRRALDFADDQVLRAYGFRHAALGNDSVRPLPFDYPAAATERKS